MEVKQEDIKPDTSTESMKVLPPWMIKAGMNLTKEQRGEIKQESQMDNKTLSSSNFSSDDKKSIVQDEDQNNIQVTLDTFQVIFLVF